MAKIFPEEKLSFIFSSIRGKSSWVVRLWTKSSRETKDQASFSFSSQLRRAITRPQRFMKGKDWVFIRWRIISCWLAPFSMSHEAVIKVWGVVLSLWKLEVAETIPVRKHWADAGFICFSPKPFENSERASEAEEAVMAARLT